jgi:hypothetical protein
MAGRRPGDQAIHYLQSIAAAGRQLRVERGIDRRKKKRKQKRREEKRGNVRDGVRK